MENSIAMQSNELATSLWAIANNLRGTMDSSKFKDYILGVIFYRYLSEKTEAYMDDLLRDDNVTYREALADKELAAEVRKMAFDHLGYIIEPDDLFDSIIAKIDSPDFSVEVFECAVNKLSASAIGQDSEPVFNNIFDDMDLQDKDLGKEVSDRTKNIRNVLKRINALSFSQVDSDMDVLGTAYMQLIALFASDAGKKGGQFFTPTCASKLLARIATFGLDKAESVADICGGSGSLLLQVRDALPSHQVGHYYSQELNGSTFNLLRMNMLMHVPYKKFSLFNCDSLDKDNFYSNGKPIMMTVQVANPPFSQKWSADKKYLDDPRYNAVGTLAPAHYADLAFVESMIYHMADNGRIAVLLPHGVLFRGNAEKRIRKYLIDKANILDAIIGLPPNMFHGTTIPVCIMVLKKNRNGNSGNVLFIDASKEYKKGRNSNELTDEQVDAIVELYTNRKDVEGKAHVASIEEIVSNDYNLNIPRYVDTFEKEPPIDVQSLIEEMAKNDEEIAEIETQFISMMKELSATDPNKQAELDLLMKHFVL